MTTARFRLLQLAVLSMSILLALLAVAKANDGKLRTPTGPPILTVEGNISATNANGKAVFDREMLEALGKSTIETTTPWFNGLVKFEGVPLKRVLEAVDADGSEIVALALNDYRTTIPMSDIRNHNVILALKRDGEYMPVSDKGPLFVVYPYDTDRLHTQQYYARSLWQLARLIVR